MFRGIPVDVASIYEGERIHADQTYADLGRELGVELLRVASDTEVTDGQVYDMRVGKPTTSVVG